MSVLHEHPPKTPPLPVTALEHIAAGLAQVERHVAVGPVADPTTPRSIRLIAAADYDVWLVTWPPDSELRDHDHGESTCVRRVVTGSLLESVETCYWVARPGTSVVTPPHTRHWLWNASAEKATTLHVYSPPLGTVTYHQGATAHPGGRAAGTMLIRSGAAEATAPSLAQSRGPERAKRPSI